MNDVAASHANGGYPLQGSLPVERKAYSLTSFRLIESAGVSIQERKKPLRRAQRLKLFWSLRSVHDNAG